jgi:hypothetical protein
MVRALLAAFLRNRPPWVQAVMFGMHGTLRRRQRHGRSAHSRIGSATPVVLVVAAFAGGAFSVALRSHLCAGQRPLCAAVRALLGAGGSRVAVLAIVPIVLLAPPASSEPGCSLVAARSLPRPRHVRGRPADQAGRWRSPTRRDRLAGRFTRAG